MTQETKICQNCKQNFVIEPEDFAFYNRIQVPPPTFCPQCRMQQKLASYNERALFRLKCQAPGHSEDIISRYSPETNHVVYDQNYWWSDKWDPMDYGREYDFSKPFFAQFRELSLSVPVANVRNINSVNCEFCTWASNSKNCYLVSGAYFSEDCMYSDTPALSRNCIDTSISIFCETMYECYSCTRCFKLLFSEYCIDCLDSSFLSDCRNCSDCFGCVGLRNKQYHIFNKPYTKKEYEAEILKINLGNYEVLQEIRAKYEKFKESIPRKYMFEKNTVNCTGNDLDNAKNCKFSFEVRDGAENCKYLLVCGRRIKDSYDMFAGGEKCELAYSSIAFSSQNIAFADGARECIDSEYISSCRSCRHVFGCVSLDNKEYCILNKQYTKEEYGKLLPKIKKHMNETPYVDKVGKVYRYGEFFPPEFSYCAYNNSLAQDYFPLTKEQALTQGFLWRDGNAKQYQNAINPETLSNDIKDIGKNLLSDKVVICTHKGECAHQCKGAFKITPRELGFYRRLNVPLPRLCSDCRHFGRIAGKKKYQLWERGCMCEGKKSKNPISYVEYTNQTKHFHNESPCPNQFNTSYSSEDREIIYCSECYQSEIQ